MCLQIIDVQCSGDIEETQLHFFKLEHINKTNSVVRKKIVNFSCLFCFYLQANNVMILLF